MDLHTFLPGEALPPLDDWYPWPARQPWLRCMMVTTLDGASRGHDGLSGSLSNPADQHVFSEVRRFAHAIVIGAGTLRAERYTPVTAGPDAVTRQANGMAAAPVLVVVTSSLDLPWDDAVFHDSAVPPIIVTTEKSLVAHGTGETCGEIVTVPGARVEPAQLISALAYRGLVHVVCEGGPTLVSELVRAHRVDEADITIAPLQAAGGQVVTGTAMEAPEHLPLVSLIEQDGWLFTRYVRTLT
jgi:riboflavin biosynthesis pyrimidine reductase